MINIHSTDELSKEARQEVDGGLMALAVGFTLRELELRFDGPIPQHLLDAVVPEKVTSTPEESALYELINERERDLALAKNETERRFYRAQLNEHIGELHSLRQGHKAVPQIQNTQAAE